ncbi:hypothetical protein KUTeg_010505 [Tegillarca granosa]|uniref:Uncharacterized protein n=1 Tax=Tegillarca granosa TaxID=220873 RepID=A0ABQ9F7W9_TEGGR|nr:hypothetical protein KUTeg_010505 [Tegillarca granosa]
MDTKLTEENSPIFINGISVPGRPLKLNYTNNHYATAYANLFDAQGKWYNDSGLIISLEKFTDGYALYCFNLENLFPEEQYLNLLKTGNIRLEAAFDTALTTPYTIIAYAEFEKIVQIDKTRTVSFM